MKKHDCGTLMEDGWCPWCYSSKKVHDEQEAWLAEKREEREPSQ